MSPMLPPANKYLVTLVPGTRAAQAVPTLDRAVEIAAAAPGRTWRELTRDEQLELRAQQLREFFKRGLLGTEEEAKPIVERELEAIGA